MVSHSFTWVSFNSLAISSIFLLLNSNGFASSIGLLKFSSSLFIISSASLSVSALGTIKVDFLNFSESENSSIGSYPYLAFGCNSLRKLGSSISIVRFLVFRTFALWIKGSSLMCWKVVIVLLALDSWSRIFALLNIFDRFHFSKRFLKTPACCSWRMFLTFILSSLRLSD